MYKSVLFSLLSLILISLVVRISNAHHYGQTSVTLHRDNGLLKLSDIAAIRLKRDGETLKRFRREMDVGWAIINEEVDTVIPLVLQHLHNMNVEQFYLPNIREHISVRPLIATYNALLDLTNGVAYNLAGVQRYGPAYMTYKEQIFLIRFYLNVSYLQFEYDFVLRLLAIAGTGNVIGFMEDSIMYLYLGLDVRNYKMLVYDFRMIQFRKLQVHLGERSNLMRDISGIILSPITNLFKEHVTTSISDNLKEQFQTVMDDFNKRDPLELRKFIKQILGGLTGVKNETLHE